MIEVRHATERGTADLGWLDSKHTFSFGSYHDPAHMGFGNLRVINDDRVQPGKGFATHGHENMEIISYILDGALEHKDSMGNGAVMTSGEVQRMTAGTGVTHSEFNHSSNHVVHFLQIWILPEQQGLEPGYEQKNFSPADKNNKLLLIASPRGREGSISIHQQVDIYASLLDPAATVTHQLGESRQAWLQVASGGVDVNGYSLGEGDGASISDTTDLQITAVEEAEFLLFDLAR
jgi:redox-sensitive bicupin YhaK (pirin superfamily)